MKQKNWQRLGRFIAAHPKLVEWIIKNAQTKPYFDIDDYMKRWWLTPRFLLTRDRHGNLFPYEWVPQILKVRVQHILREDVDRHKHDHPSDNQSIILKGYYVEEDVFDRVKTLYAGQTVERRAETFHRIVEVPPEGVWTLWFLAEYRQKWGFLVGGRKIRYEEYLATRDAVEANYSDSKLE